MLHFLVVMGCISDGEEIIGNGAVDTASAAMRWDIVCLILRARKS